MLSASRAGCFPNVSSAEVSGGGWVTKDPSDQLDFLHTARTVFLARLASRVPVSIACRGEHEFGQHDLPFITPE